MRYKGNTRQADNSGKATLMCRMLNLLLPFVVAASVFAGAANSQGMGAEEARHLLNRTGFDAGLAEIDAFASLSRRERVERLLGAAGSAARTHPRGHMTRI